MAERASGSKYKTNDGTTKHFRSGVMPPEMDTRTTRVLCRDVCFLLVGFVALSIVGFVESHSSEPEARMMFQADTMAVSSPYGIVDTGFILTHPLYEWLKANPGWVDILAALNSWVLVVPFLYSAHVTFWKGDHSLAFQIISIQLLRAFCGWYTHLPADHQYLNSNYDFPDVVHCLFRDCQDTSPKAIPFVSFFSGHCATMIVVGNYMWLNGHRRGSVIIHALNVLQVIRLLATRGHYSIDIIIGFFIATQATHPARLLGRFYSRLEEAGANVQDVVPATSEEAFETVMGVATTRNERRLLALLQRPEVQKALESLDEEKEGEAPFCETLETTTILRILLETAFKIMQDQALLFQEHMRYLREQARKHAVALVQEHVNHLQEQAWLHFLETPSMVALQPKKKRE